MATRQELKEAYKQLNPMMGVFQIRHLPSGKIFIGSSINLEAIKNRTRVQLNFGNHPNVGLQEAWTTFGEEQFAFEVISQFQSKEDDLNKDYAAEVKQLEAMFIDEMKPFGDKGYHV